jgi:erythromycin esterase-like protein
LDDTPFGVVRAVVWAHNSHLGDARATQMGSWGELNLGQLARERHGDRAFLIGFTTHTGTVTGAREWNEPAEWRRVVDRFVLARTASRDALAEARLERTSHYFRGRMPDQFDAVIHIDTTSALTPLERWSREIPICRKRIQRECERAAGNDR